MIPRYRLLAERIRTELQSVQRVVDQAEGAIARAEQHPQDKDYFIAAAAFELHGAYAGIERIFEMIAGDIEGSRPGGSNWHRELLTQMTLSIAGVRPAVLTAETYAAVIDYLEFRHVVRHMYTFNLKPDRIVELVHALRPAVDWLQRDLLVFARFLDNLSAADTA